MRIRCIDDEPIIRGDGGISDGKGLKKGVVYESNQIVDSGSHGDGLRCYWIEGLGKKLTCRFKVLKEGPLYYNAEVDPVKVERELAEQN